MNRFRYRTGKRTEVCDRHITRDGSFRGHGRRKIGNACLLIDGGAGLAIIFAPSFSVLLLLRFLQGIGIAGLVHSFEKVKERGYDEVYIGTHSENPAQRLYKRLGFKVEREEPNLTYYFKENEES